MSPPEPSPARAPRPAGQAHAAGAAVILALALLPTAASVAVGALAGADLTQWVRLLATAAVYAPVAAVSLRFRRFDIAVVEGALAILSGWFALLSLLHALAPDAPALFHALVGVAHLWGLAELAALGLLAWLLMPRRVRAPRWGMALGVAAIALELIFTVGQAALPSPVWDAPVPLGIAILSLATATVVLARGWRPTGPRGRAASRWFLVGALLLLISYARMLPMLPPLAAGLADAVFVLSHACLPLGIMALSGVTTRARRTGDIVALVQSLAFGVSAYLAVTAVADAAGADPLLGGAAAAAALALVFGATARVTRERLGEIFAATPPDARSVLARVAAHLASAGDEGGLRGLAAALRDTWELASAEIDLAATGAVVAGRPAGQAVSVPLVSAGREVGTVTVTGDDHAWLTREVRPVLEQTAGLIAVAAQLAMVNEEVAATRRRTLEVRREERRVLHGELHDSLAPALAGIGMRIAAADTMLAHGDPRWRDELSGIRTDTGVLTEDVRRLSRTLLPTALDQGDLDGALGELAVALSGPGMRIEVQARGADVLASDDQLRVYLLLAECLVAARRTPGLAWARASVAPGPRSTRVAARVGPGSYAADDAATLLLRAQEFGASGVHTDAGGLEAVFGR